LNLKPQQVIQSIKRLVL